MVSKNIISSLSRLGVEPKLMVGSRGSVSLDTEPKNLEGKAKLLIEMNEHVIVETLKEERDSWLAELYRHKPSDPDPFRCIAESIYYLWLKEFISRKYGVNFNGK